VCAWAYNQSTSSGGPCGRWQIFSSSNEILLDVTRAAVGIGTDGIVDILASMELTGPPVISVESYFQGYGYGYG